MKMQLFMFVVLVAQLSLRLLAGDLLVNAGVWPDDKGVHVNAHGGGVIFENGLYWWYGEHKVYGETGNRAHVGVHVYSSSNLVAWADRGIALAVSNDEKSDIADGCILERPKVLRSKKTGKFVMYFHLS